MTNGESTEKVGTRILPGKLMGCRTILALLVPLLMPCPVATQNTRPYWGPIFDAHLHYNIEAGEPAYLASPPTSALTGGSSRLAPIDTTRMAKTVPSMPGMGIL